MPRKAFVADVGSASQRAIGGFRSVCRGDDDGDVVAVYVPSGGIALELSLLVLDIGLYPSKSKFMIFTRCSDVPPGIEAILESIAESSYGQTVPELLGIISQRLHRHFEKRLDDESLTLDDGIDAEKSEQVEEAIGDSEDDYEGDIDDNVCFPGDSDDDFQPSRNGKTLLVSTNTTGLKLEAALIVNQRIRSDLKAVRFAGFKIGILCGMKADSATSLMSISVQVRKLELSDEAIQAWYLEPHQYIVVLMKWSTGYKPFELVISEPATSQNVEFRVGISNKYKPTIEEATAAFSDSSKDSNKHEDVKMTKTGRLDMKPAAGFMSMFISSSLDEFIKHQLISLLKIRYSLGFDWDGAKRYQDYRLSQLDRQSTDIPSHCYEDTNTTGKDLPDIVLADHLCDHQAKAFSFPLITAQFALRYLIRCTEFCLVCHNKIAGDFEALKPYVCDNPLCLYQYMSLGFGPSVEHEILTQPYVVDLLISFCYSSAVAGRLREYPTGMSLRVPPILESSITPGTTSTSIITLAANPTRLSREKPLPADHLVVGFDINRNEVIFGEKVVSCPVRNGEWVSLITLGRHPYHFRVEDISFFPTVKLSETVATRNLDLDENSTAAVIHEAPTTTPLPSQILLARMIIYNQNFDDMDIVEKSDTIATLIRTLPSVREMKVYLLEQSRFTAPRLRIWKNRVSPAALGILRWIIASNRSCIVQVDKYPGQDDVEVFNSKIRLDQRIRNISAKWVQFRFAQGSPDKEQRFLNALRSQEGNLDPKYPTIFAFHGSALSNWHSIIRTGLDFKEILHGRAYGHGVYHAQDQNTSAGYSHYNADMWYGSELKISSAMSLNEIVNCPEQFISSSPYLVVDKTDWIQCRYLLVKTQCDTDTYSSEVKTCGVTSESNPEMEIEQDPSRMAKSSLNEPIGIPQCAASTSRAFHRAIIPNTRCAKKRRQTSTISSNVCSMTELGAVSDSEDTSDLTFLLSDDDSISKDRNATNRENFISKNVSKWTNFTPGALDQSELPILIEPEYATSVASKTLNRNLHEILEIQKRTPLSELGWYIDPELINNVYQWIVELHSFDPSLPLSQDMVMAGCTSIVLEMRFGKDFPFSPPFIRIIRPRFLPFTQGGGGHVTAGGALCMELLTNSGWSSASSIEGVLLQVRLALSNLEPRPARLEGRGRKQYYQDYGAGEAMVAYVRACNVHGWEVPKDFQEFAGIMSDE